jgi:lactoylglutathione lyase
VVQELFPIVSTPDLPRALRFYRELLGGRVSYQFAGPDGEPGYVGVDLGRSHLGIARLPPDEGAFAERRSISLWVYVDDCDATIDRLRRAGVTITEEPVDQPWGERVARVGDPDGNEVIVGARGTRDAA